MPSLSQRLTRRARRLVWIAPLLAALPATARIAVTDDTGATVTLARPAQRVVSLAPHATELLFAAGGGARIVGAVAYSDYPSAARDIPRVGDSRSLDLERIAALKPDLAVVWPHGNAPQQIDRLRALGIPLFFSEPRRMAEIPRAIETLGALLGTADAARASARSFRQQADALRERAEHRAPVTVFLQIGESPLMTLSGQHIFSDMLALCGGRNVFAHEPSLAPTVSTEAVIAADPEALLISSASAAPNSDAARALFRWKRWPALRAVRHGNLFVLDGDRIVRPGPRLIEGAARLCANLEQARQRRARPPGNAASR